jgi:hypothetical protein
MILGIVVSILEHYQRWRLGFPTQGNSSMTLTDQFAKQENAADTIANLAAKPSSENSPRPAVNFGIHDTRTCTECKNVMRITRRAPHPIYGLALELQTFTCRICKHESKRSADVAGEVI